jgi:hypothetical protein
MFIAVVTYSTVPSRGNFRNPTLFLKCHRASSVERGNVRPALDQLLIDNQNCQISGQRFAFRKIERKDKKLFVFFFAVLSSNHIIV